VKIELPPQAVTETTTPAPIVPDEHFYWEVVDSHAPTIGKETVNVTKTVVEPTEEVVPVTTPVLDPVTGEPLLDPVTGEPQVEPVVD